MARAWHSVAQRGQFANGRALQLMATHQQRPKMFLNRSTDYSITKTYYSSTKDDLRWPKMTKDDSESVAAPDEQSCCMSTKTLDRRLMYFPTPWYGTLRDTTGPCHAMDSKCFDQTSLPFCEFSWSTFHHVSLSCSFVSFLWFFLCQGTEIDFAQRIEGPHLHDTHAVSVVIRQGKGAESQHQAVRHTCVDGTALSTALSTETFRISNLRSHCWRHIELSNSSVSRNNI